MRRSALPRLRSLLLVAAACSPAFLPAQVPVIPAPATVILRSGTWLPSVSLPADLALTGDEALARAGIDVQVVPGSALVDPESYSLDVSSKGVTLIAPSAAGRFYGLVTLQHLVNVGRDVAGAVRIPALTIVDSPRFPYRGMHLDVGRHFQPVAFVKRYIDLMARFKFNVFHWHLTEDQGWRIEIKKYPRLTEVGGCRAETMVEKRFDPYVGDGTPHCGFYTQEEIREVVAYAAERFVTVIPEIEMPGHSLAAITAYPELACTDGPFAVRTTWGVSEDVLCPSERTFEFLQDVLTEVLDLFPSPYIHIGGDEAPKKRWKESPLAQEVIRREGLKDEDELQSWFIRRIERWLAERDRRLIGWDEILEGGLAPGATVMSWRGMSGGIAAAQQGHDVIMTPGSHVYFDHYQGDPRFEPLAIGGLTTLERVYGFEPIPEALTASQSRHVLGAQANLWTEYLKTPAAIEYMAYPRAVALSEVLWSSRERRDWGDFLGRLPYALRTLDMLRVNYRVPDVIGLEGDALTLGTRIPVALFTPMGGAIIRYTVDGSDVTMASPLYRGPFELPVPAEGVTLTARVFVRDGRASAPRSATFRRTTYREAERLGRRSTTGGLRLTYVEAAVRSTAAIDSLQAERTEVIARVRRPGNERPEQYALRFDGYLDVPQDGLYEFALTSDDGSVLDIGGVRVVDNDGLHGSEQKSGMIALRKGPHPLVVRYFQAGGGAELGLFVRRAGEEWREVPAEWFRHAP